MRLLWPSKRSSSSVLAGWPLLAIVPLLLSWAPIVRGDACADCWARYTQCCSDYGGSPPECEAIRPECDSICSGGAASSDLNDGLGGGEVQASSDQPSQASPDPIPVFEPVPEPAPAPAPIASAQQFNSGGGDLPFYNLGASGHQQPHNGRTLNTYELDNICGALGLPSAGDMIGRLDAVGAYNPGQSMEQKFAGAYLALSMAAKFRLMPPQNIGGCEDSDDYSNGNSCAYKAGNVYGSLKVAAMSNAASIVRDWLYANGGGDGGLSDQQLVVLWSGNEHQNLHAILFGNEDIRNAMHATSLNDNDGGRSGGIILGGFNDRGEYPQWGWLQGARNFNGMLGV